MASAAQLVPHLSSSSSSAATATTPSSSLSSSMHRAATPRSSRGRVIVNEATTSGAGTGARTPTTTTATTTTTTTFATTTGSPTAILTPTSANTLYSSPASFNVVKEEPADDRDSSSSATGVSEPARKKQKRNKPTLSCHECVERKTKVSPQSHMPAPAMRISFLGSLCAPPSWKLYAAPRRTPMPCRVPILSFASSHPTRHMHAALPRFPGLLRCETSVPDIIHDVLSDISSHPHRKCCRKTTQLHTRRSSQAALSRPVCSLSLPPSLTLSVLIAAVDGDAP